MISSSKAQAAKKKDIKELLNDPKITFLLGMLYFLIEFN